jgi:hypothetical protein
VCLFFAGDPGSARVPRSLRGEGAMVNAGSNFCVNLSSEYSAGI